MKIVLFGASGKTGRLVLDLALNAGHEVTAVVRDASKIKISHENLTVKTANLFDEDSITEVSSNAELAISCLGGDANNKSTLLSDMIKFIVPAIKKAGVNEMFHISSAGIHDEMPGIIAKLFVNLFFKNAIADHKIAANTIINSGLDYLILRPLSLVNGEMTKNFRTSDTCVPKGGKNISREDVAYFLVNAIGKLELKNKSICLCY